MGNTNAAIHSCIHKSNLSKLDCEKNLIITLSRGGVWDGSSQTGNMARGQMILYSRFFILFFFFWRNGCCVAQTRQKWSSRLQCAQKAQKPGSMMVWGFISALEQKLLALLWCINAENYRDFRKQDYQGKAEEAWLIYSPELQQRMFGQLKKQKNCNNPVLLYMSENRTH